MAGRRGQGDPSHYSCRQLQHGDDEEDDVEDGEDKDHGDDGDAGDGGVDDQCDDDKDMNIKDSGMRLP